MDFHLKRISKYIYVVLTCLLTLIVLNIYTQTYPLNFFGESIASDGNTIKVFCWNVKCHDQHYAINQKEIAANILTESPDIIFLCEFALSKSKVIDSILTSTYKRYYISGTNGVFYSKYVMEGLHEITHKGQTSKHSLIVAADAIVNNDTLTLVGSHLSSSRKAGIGAVAKRTEEAKAIVSEIEDCKHPIIIMGDLNDVSGSHTLNTLQETGLKDAWWEQGRGYGSTFHGYGLRLRIDHILYDAGLNLKSIKKVDSKELSDHDALVAEFWVE